MEFRDRFVGLEPVWTSEPDPSVIRKLTLRHLEMDPNTEAKVMLFSSGAFNKIYKVDALDKSFVFRVTVPIYPTFKILSDLGTMDFVRTRTDLPVPTATGYSSSSDNELGFEYMLIDFIPGPPLWRRYRHLPMARKHELTTRLAHFQYELTRPQNCFQEVGSIYKTSDQAENDTQSTSPTFGIGRSTEQSFWVYRSAIRHSTRGPFSTVSSWLKARILDSRRERQYQIDNPDADATESDTEEVNDVAEASIDWGRALEETLDVAFPPEKDNITRAALRHPDLQEANILVDENDGRLLSVIDWEMATTVPLAMAYSMPKLLRGQNREKEPKRDEYSAFDPSCYAVGYIPPDYGDNEGKCDSYWEHLQEWELTQFRKIYADEMRRLTPEYDQLRQERERLEEWDEAVTALGCEYSFDKIETLLEKFNAGQDDETDDGASDEDEDDHSDVDVDDEADATDEDLNDHAGQADEDLNDDTKETDENPCDKASNADESLQSSGNESVEHRHEEATEQETIGKKPRHCYHTTSTESQTPQKKRSRS